MAKSVAHAASCFEASVTAETALAFSALTSERFAKKVKTTLRSVHAPVELDWLSKSSLKVLGFAGGL